MTRYRPVETKVDLPALELRVLAFWKERDVFRRSIALRAGAPEWVFYDGPPTANNKPHIGHVEARTFKDMYPRYRTMRGHHVDRKAGWDCHGLPVEVEVEKEIGTKSKRDIERFGVAEFVQLCRDSVIRYVDDWKHVSERMGHWIDMDDAYWTMDSSYVQSVWWALKQLYERDLLYRDDRTVAYCPRCGTGLSDAEIALGYTTVVDPSVYVEFPVTDGDPRVVGAAIVGWTTTPWTLTSNLGLAVAAGEPYVRVRVPGRERDLVVAEARVDDLARAAGGTPEVVERVVGSDLVGAHYEPPFPNVAGPNNHRVVAADFVVMNEGTGIVHIAPGFGADDLALGRREGWPRFRPIDDAGVFTDEAPEFVRGRFVKDADPMLIDDLGRRGLLVKAEDYEHTYPLCWRCDTPLLYVARPSWYVRTTAFKDQLLEENARTNWYPGHIRDGRYGNWLENNVDWSLSRERYWGTPLPIWVCGAGHEVAVGSLAELSELSGRDVTALDPHRPHIDEVTIACRTCHAEARRVPEVIDAWFDSGAMPYAQWAYGGPGSPGEEEFRRKYPADFIAEGLDQTRGWFYSLMAEGVLLFGQNSYRNVICHGLVLDAEGRKMSKRLGNAIAPMEAFERQGADAVRWYMVASGSPWADRRLSFEAIGDVVRHFVLTLWNTYAFYVTYANIDEPDLATAPAPADRPPLDRWMLSRLHGVVTTVTSDMDGYDATGAGRSLEDLVDDLSNWYVRRSRRRFWDVSRTGSEDDAAAGKLAAFATLHECLVTIAKMLAPFMPFVTEEVYANLAAGDPNAPESVHLSDWPVPDASLIDPALEEAMAVVRTAVSLGRTVRNDTKVRVRQPLAGAVLHVPGDRSRLEPLLGLMAEELNVRRVRFAESADELSGWRAKPNFRSLGPKLGPRVQEVAQALAADDGTLAARVATGETVTVDLDGGPVELAPGDVELAQQTRAGWGLASDGPVTVALELTLDDELRREGLARELVHHVQALRKSAGLEVSDRIVLGIESDGAVAEALAAHRDWIAAEVLATSIEAGPADGATASEDVSVDGVGARDLTAPRLTDGPPDACPPRRAAATLDGVTHAPAPIDAAPLQVVAGEQDKSVTLPARAYTAPDVLEWERRVFFDGSWACAGRATDLPNAQDQRAIRVGTQGIVLVRGDDGVLRGFFNACRHRGHELLPCDFPTVSARVIQCPYHAWTYGLDGTLRGAPRFSDVAGFDKQDYPLIPARVEEWHGWLFVNASGDAAPLAEHVGNLDGLLANYEIGRMFEAARHDYVVKANWKTITENYHECYHCPSIHPELCEVTPTDSGRNFEHTGAWVGGDMDLKDFAQTMSLDGQSKGVPIRGLDDYQLRTVLYVGLLPNMLISLHPDYVMTHRMEPLSPTETRVECVWLFPPEAHERPDFEPSYASDFWDITNRQDWAACESVTRGIASQGFRQGPFSWSEDEVHQFMAMIARSYLAGAITVEPGVHGRGAAVGSS